MSLAIACPKDAWAVAWAKIFFGSESSGRSPSGPPQHCCPAGQGPLCAPWSELAGERFDALLHSYVSAPSFGGTLWRRMPSAAAMSM